MARTRHRRWLYNRRSELAAATVRYGYAYDAEKRLVSVTSAAETNGAIRVLNAYDHRNRRIRKTVQRLNSSIAPPPSLPVEIREWQTLETHTFVWDGNNIVLEKVEFANGTPRTFEYFWGADKSGTEQGAGGVGGLLYLKRNGTIYVPHADAYGNILRYTDTAGTVVAEYTYNAFGRLISSSGPMAEVFRIRFSSKYYDPETGLYYYGYRFYSPALMRWLNRDPIEEDGGLNLYGFCGNDAIFSYDLLGNTIVVIRHLHGIVPPGGWGDAGRNRAQTHYLEPKVTCKKVKKGNCKIGFSVAINPPITIVYMYFRDDADLIIAKQHENEHLHWIRIYDNAIETFKKEAEQIVDCPKAAYSRLSIVNKKMNRVKSWAATENNKLDGKGGPHGH